MGSRAATAASGVGTRLPPRRRGWRRRAFRNRSCPSMALPFPLSGRHHARRYHRRLLDAVSPVCPRPRLPCRTAGSPHRRRQRTFVCAILACLPRAALCSLAMLPPPIRLWPALWLPRLPLRRRSVRVPWAWASRPTRARRLTDTSAMCSVHLRAQPSVAARPWASTGCTPRPHQKPVPWQERCLQRKRRGATRRPPDMVLHRLRPAQHRVRPRSASSGLWRC